MSVPLLLERCDQSTHPSLVSNKALIAFVWASTQLLALTPTAAWSQSCAGGLDPGARGQFTTGVRLENDALGGRGQDQNYTGGTLVTVRSPDLTSFTDDRCLPASFRWINGKLSWLQPEDVDQRNFVFGVAHLAFTPQDRLRADVVQTDRPYASALLFSVGYNGRKGDDLKVNQLRVGLVGPATQGERVQNAYHDTLGLKRFLGWNNQLRNELLVQWVHERLHRWSTDRTNLGWGADFISHWGGGLGNFATYGNVGAEWRFGWRLPDDFGSAAVRPGGDNLAPGSRSSRLDGMDAPGGIDAHLFATADLRGVLRDITLDGNTFSSSHHIEKRRWVSEVGVGFSMRAGRWKLAIARYVRSREFVGQQEVSAYGAVSVNRVF